MCSSHLKLVLSNVMTYLPSNNIQTKYPKFNSPNICPISLLPKTVLIMGGDTIQSNINIRMFLLFYCLIYNT